MRQGHKGRGPDRRDDRNDSGLIDKVVHINRVTKVVKGGKNFSFSALVVVGDGQGKVGYGSGKAKEVPSAIKKGIEVAKKNMITIAMDGTTIPHAILGRFGAGRVMLKPASEGTGVIAGGPVRAILESAGIQNILTKSLGTANPHNVIKATFDGLTRLKTQAEYQRMRGKTEEAVDASSEVTEAPAEVPAETPDKAPAETPDKAPAETPDEAAETVKAE